VAETTNWQRILADRLPLYGHRNWIVAADSAYPAQARGGIETVVTGAEQMTVVEDVLKQLAASRHVRPIVHLDAEIERVGEREAPGVDEYRWFLARVLGNLKPDLLLHEEILARLDRAGQLFHVLILKSNLTIPYTSVFFELDCAYWSADAERRMREASSPQFPLKLNR